MSRPTEPQPKGGGDEIKSELRNIMAELRALYERFTALGEAPAPSDPHHRSQLQVDIEMVGRDLGGAIAAAEKMIRLGETIDSLEDDFGQMLERSRRNRGHRSTESDPEKMPMTVADYEALSRRRRKEANPQDSAGMERMSDAMGLPVDFERCRPQGGVVRIVFRDEDDLIGIHDVLTVRH